jgi:hypothetical protein
MPFMTIPFLNKCRISVHHQHPTHLIGNWFVVFPLSVMMHFAIRKNINCSAKLVPKHPVVYCIYPSHYFSHWQAWQLAAVIFAAVLMILNRRIHFPSTTTLFFLQFFQCSILYFELFKL